MIELRVPPKLFRILSFYKEDEFNRFLHEKLVEYRRYFEWNNREALLKRKKELEEKIKRMKEELEELEEFCKVAEKEQKMMERWIDDIEYENQNLMKELRKNGDFVKN
ncbi:hypothetical protein [Candidatus Aciduliprofundum boonei]|uniref:Uncharacterized protein n=1 Tax=Aciduliprofundum boonei (strain DSM 19572 / T469) TaxID=439481 RepID=D3TD03_ACIB4|nr:hypothetical protein [Candidatus Aciduliprofundum boonei]ADD08438.1 hypothetical protein Aboo_0627 [Aciduliprofundum boonei T469]HII55481.1 hypothetical protein [Candidatus Aciduliprofundum boonei]